jgi:hypothetical protein
VAVAPPAVPTQVRDAVVAAYYPRALAVADTARSRAQAAYGIASAIAAALVAAGVFGDLDDRRTIVQIFGVAALALWLLAAGLFLVAVSAPFHETPPNQKTAEAFVLETLGAATKERTRVEQFSIGAAIVAGLAALVTAATFALALFYPPTEEHDAKVLLTAKGTASVEKACGSVPVPLKGQLVMDDLQKEFVAVKLDAGSCGLETGPTVAIPRAQVRAVSVEP